MMQIHNNTLKRPFCGLSQRLYRVQGFVLALGLLGFMPASIASSHTTDLKRADVTIETVNREFRLDGVVEAINKSTVSAQTSGTIKEILVDVDDYVKKGAVIIRLKDRSQQAQLKKALAGEKEAISHLANAKDEFARTKDVFKKKVVSQAKMDEAKHALSAAKARLESARASLEQAREQLSYTQVKAPYSGIVTKRHVEVGETVSAGTKLMTGLSLEKLRVNVDVPQNLIRKIRRFDKAFVYTESDAGLQQVPVDKITIFPVADRASNTFKVRLDLPVGTRGLFPGMFVKASLVTGEKQEVLVPKQSIVHRSELTAVYVLTDDGDIHFRHVRLGNLFHREQDGDAYIVLSGLSVGETVALDPIEAGVVLMAQRKHAGDRVEP